jgi:mannose-6-phosphate isomerase-like protein (cupin superfamily)
LTGKYIGKRAATGESRSHTDENFCLSDHVIPDYAEPARRTNSSILPATLNGDDMIQMIDIGAVAGDTPEGYSNKVLTSVNDHDVHVSVMDAPFFWHFHPDSDETFFVVEGALTIEFEDGSIDLQAGQLLTVPAGTRHRTRPVGARSVNLTVEKKDATTVQCDAPPHRTARLD